MSFFHVFRYFWRYVRTGYVRLSPYQMKKEPSRNQATFLTPPAVPRGSFSTE